MTEEQKRKNRYKKQVQQYVDIVTSYITDRNGYFPSEYGLSIEMLKQYYMQFLYLCDEINNLDSMVVDTRYGKQPNALLKARDATATKLNEILRSLGCTFYTQVNMKMNQPSKKADESALEAFVHNAEKKKKEYR